MAEEMFGKNKGRKEATSAYWRALGSCFPQGGLGEGLPGLEG